jgi:hypothetical protein
MQTALPALLPKTLEGTVCRQWVRCGRSNCRCAVGRLHGPYYYRLWRVDGKVKKVYVRAADLDRVRAQCRARQDRRRALAAAWDQWRRLTAQVRELEPR